MARPKAPSDYINQVEKDLDHLEPDEWLEWLKELKSEIDLKIETATQELWQK